MIFVLIFLSSGHHLVTSPWQPLHDETPGDIKKTSPSESHVIVIWRLHSDITSKFFCDESPSNIKRKSSDDLPKSNAHGVFTIFKCRLPESHNVTLLSPYLVNRRNEIVTVIWQLSSQKTVTKELQGDWMKYNFNEIISI